METTRPAEKAVQVFGHLFWRDFVVGQAGSVKRARACQALTPAMAEVEFAPPMTKILSRKTAAACHDLTWG